VRSCCSVGRKSGVARLGRVLRVCACERALGPPTISLVTGSLGRWCRLGIWGTALYCTTFSTLQPTPSVVPSTVFNDFVPSSSPTPDFPKIRVQYVRTYDRFVCCLLCSEHFRAFYCTILISLIVRMCVIKSTKSTSFVLFDKTKWFDLVTIS